MALPTPKYTSGDFTVAARVGAYQFSNPIPRDNNPYVLREDLMVANASWATTALNTAHPDFATFVLCSESERQNIGGGLVQWERTYGKVPPTWSEYIREPYQFIGMSQDGSFEGDTRQRDTVVETVWMRVQHSYYLVGTGGLASVSLIPLSTRQKYLGIASGGNENYVKYLFAFSRPTKDQYIALIGAEMVAEDSVAIPWVANGQQMGNIWEVQTRYVMAQ